MCAFFLLWAFVTSPAVQAQSQLSIVSTGSSLPLPLYNTWNEEYNKTQSSVQVRYLPLGTQESITRIIAGTGDFGGGEAIITEAEAKGAHSKILQLPTVLLGLVIVYHTPGIADGLHLSGPVIAEIFLGKIKSWNDPAIAKLNPGVHLPDTAIAVVHRTEGKGSNYILSDYLSKVSPEFSAKVGRSPSPKWPVGEAKNRSEDMNEAIKATPGSIGYAEMNWALQGGLNMVSVRNAAGEFVGPSFTSVAAAALAQLSKMKDDFRVSLTNGPGAETYPITSFTWFYVPETAADPARGRAVANYLKWVYDRGQQIAQERGYSVLPDAVLEKARQRAATIR
jgi:phosphate transport system substrate-binding protein